MIPVPLAQRFALPAALAWLAASAPAPASLVAYDSFDTYAANADLSGQNGGTGWQTAWSAAASVDVVNASLAYAGGSLSIDGGDRAVRVNSEATQLLDRQFTTIATGASSEVYFSFLFQENSGNSGDFLNFWISNTGDRNGSGGMGLVSAADDDFGVRVRTTTGTDNTDLSTIVSTPGETYFLVGRFSRDGSSGSVDPLRFDLMELWINPTSLTLGTPDASMDASSGINGDLQWFGLRTVNVNGTDEYLFDELRIGTTLAAVVPEPATGALLAGGLLMLSLRRRRL